MQALSIGLTLAMVYLPVFLSIMLMVSAGILYNRVKSRSTAIFFLAR